MDNKTKVIEITERFESIRDIKWILDDSLENANYKKYLIRINHPEKENFLFKKNLEIVKNYLEKMDKEVEFDIY